MNCNKCGTQFEGKFCPNCGAPAVTETPVVNASPATPVVEQTKKKPIYKKWWFWVIIAIVAICIISASSGNNSSDSATQGYNDAISNNTAESNVEGAKITVIDFSSMSMADIEAWASTNNVTCKFSEEYSDTIAAGSVISQNKKADETVKEGTTIQVVISKGKKPSIEYQNALKKAESYSKLMHMSKKAIYNQLTSEYGEQFPADAAQYAIDNLDADYNANALAKAKSYQQTMSMSKSAIYDQLVSEYGEQFTAEEAQYAIDHLED